MHTLGLSQHPPFPESRVAEEGESLPGRTTLCWCRLPLSFADALTVPFSLLASGGSDLPIDLLRGEFVGAFAPSIFPNRLVGRRSGGKLVDILAHRCV